MSVHPVKNRVTMASIIYRVQRNALENAVAENALTDLARQIRTNSDYQQFVKLMQRIPNQYLNPLGRERIVNELHQLYGKQAGIDRRVVRGDLRSTSTHGPGVPKWIKPFVFNETSGEFFNTDTGLSISRQSFDIKYASEPEVIGAGVMPTKFASQRMGISSVHDQLYYPGKDILFTYEGIDYVNTYRDDGAVVASSYAKGTKSVELFKEHLKFLFPDEWERWLFLSYLAYLIKYPGKRVNFAVVIVGPQGVGKSYLAYAMNLILGRNCSMLDPEVIRGRFTDFGEGSTVLIVEEIRLVGKNRYEVIDKLKPFITNPVVQIEAKHRKPKQIPNVTNYIMMTNHRDAIPFGEGDRRYFVLETSVGSQEELYRAKGGQVQTGVYFDMLFDATKSNPEAIAQYLLDLELSPDFKPKGRAPDTEAKERMRAFCQSPEEQALDSALKRWEGPALNGELVDVTLLGKMHAFSQHRDEEFPSRQRLARILTQRGYGPPQRIRYADSEHTVWCKSSMTNTEIRERIEVHEFMTDPDFLDL